MITNKLSSLPLYVAEAIHASIPRLFYPQKVTILISSFHYAENIVYLQSLPLLIVRTIVFLFFLLQGQVFSSSKCFPHFPSMFSPEYQAE